MKKKLLLLIVWIPCFGISQELPTESAYGYVFPLGSKFTIKMHPTDSLGHDYSIIAFEPYEEIVDTWENEMLFAKEGEEGTIQFYFCLGTNGSTEEEKKKNRKVLLLMKNFTKKNFIYSSEIQREENGEFEKTSNVGTYSGAIGKEMWPYMIYSIGLNGFKVLNSK